MGLTGMDVGQRCEGIELTSFGMVCRTNLSVAEKVGEISRGSKLCGRVECVYIHRIVYPATCSSHSGHRSPNSRSIDTAKFPVGMSLKGQRTFWEW